MVEDAQVSVIASNRKCPCGALKAASNFILKVIIACNCLRTGSGSWFTGNTLQWLKHCLTKVAGKNKCEPLKGQSKAVSEYNKKPGCIFSYYLISSKFIYFP